MKKNEKKVSEKLKKKIKCPLHSRLHIMYNKEGECTEDCYQEIFDVVIWITLSTRMYFENCTVVYFLSFLACVGASPNATKKTKQNLWSVVMRLEKLRLKWRFSFSPLVRLKNWIMICVLQSHSNNGVGFP